MAAWLLDLSADVLHVEFTADDLMADLDPGWAGAGDDGEADR